MRSFASIVGGGGRTQDLLGRFLSGEPLGAEHLADRARAVASGQRIIQARPRRGQTTLLTRLDETHGFLLAAQARLDADRNLDVGPAGEWLLDNFHVVLEHIRDVRESLPRGYYRELPALSGGALAGYPRVFDLAVTLISHTEGRIEVDNVNLFLGAFQEVAPLTIGELWAVPAMLRLGLLENIRRMALRAVQRLDDVEEADRWAHQVHVASESGEGALEEAIAPFVQDPRRLTPIFVSRFLHQLRLAAGTTPPLARLERWIADEGLSAEDATSRSNQRLAITQLVMANSITSLRAIGGLDWRKLVERHSALDAILRHDPSGFYERMTFATRDSYRHVVERIAKGAGRTEEDVARAAVDLATAKPSDPCEAHVGYYLVDEGLPQLEQAMSYRPGLGVRVRRSVLRHPNLLLWVGALMGTGLGLALLLAAVGPLSPLMCLALSLLALLPVNDVAVTAMNQLVTSFLAPRLLPKLDLNGPRGVPPDLRTIVVIPTLLGNVAAVRAALQNLEVQYLANRETNLYFALLTDFTDAPTEHRAGDAEIVEKAVAGVRALNDRYANDGAGSLFLFHRPRRLGPTENCWMGWERKRGKLAELNAYLRGGAREAFSVVVGDVTQLASVRYVITLDADTVLPPDAAPLLIGALAHPLNRAVYNARRGRVMRGYGILQPRVVVSLPSAHASRFAAIHSGHPGVDPYTTAVSDVYQDLYGEGSYTGKGIYDVDVFEEATRGRFPEGTVLSHDLIEGSHARAGLVTDVNVYDDYPAHYLTFSRRKHRWIRGDWQLLPWLGRRVPSIGGRTPNPLSRLSRWKLLDNLRRSVTEIAVLALLVVGWTVMPGSAARWSVISLVALAGPWIVSLTLAVGRPPSGGSWRSYYATVGRDAITSVKQLLLTLAFLPHQAANSADAIMRTLWRLGVSRRNLLEWQTAEHAARAAEGTAGLVWRRMWIAPALALTTALVALRAAGIGKHSHLEWDLRLLLAVLPFALLWALSPALAHLLSLPLPAGTRSLHGSRRALALRHALLHWRFFDRFATAETRWLAPDNFQEDPTPVVAMRTSPTNIGLQLLSTVSAHDLGFITGADMALRLERAFDSIDTMPRHQGHLYNWYDLNDLRVLDPPYISTVDSGNLAGHLIALRQALLAIAVQPADDARIWGALDAALTLAGEEGKEFAARGTSPDRELRAIRAAVVAAREASVARPGSANVEALEDVARRLRLARGALTTNRASQPTDWIAWCVVRIEAQQAYARAQDPTLRSRLEALAARAYACATAMSFGFLYDENRKLFGIGYHVSNLTLDRSYYDLLASESRLASFVAIAKNDLPVEHWFRLGRTLTRAAGQTALVSWSGSMFEYLMPVLVMQSFPSTVLDETHRAAVHRQIAYGAERKVPWGVSESAYNVRDRHLTYQYRAFGVPDLALKRGLGRDLVVAPYASALAVMIEPERALANLVTLEKLGVVGPYGLRDAIDYTRPQPGQRHAVVRNYMAHHIGMGMVALTNALTAAVWQRRFHADPLVRSAELLLHERVPHRVAPQDGQNTVIDDKPDAPQVVAPFERVIDTPHTAAPHVALLGYLPYTLMVSNSGAGYSRFEDLAVTRWRADGTKDQTGQFVYLKDLKTGRVWSATHQPVCTPADQYRAVLATDRVTFHRVDGDIETRTEIVVSPEDSAEVRRVTVENHGDETREIELTSYSEIVMAPPEADRAHPAFGNLFVETEWHEWCTALTATRRPRSATERVLWCLHVVASGKERVGDVTCETDRGRFIGRGRSHRNPLAMEGELSGTTGAVLDPVFALRTRVRLEPGQSARVAFTTLVAASREQVFALADRYHDPHAAQRALDLAWTSTQVELRELAVTPQEAGVFQELAGPLFFASRGMRGPEEEQRQNRGSQPLLWAHGISGDWPILLAMIESPAGLPTLRQLFAAHHYWRRRGMMVDLVILNKQPSTYLQPLKESITAAMFEAGDLGVTDQPGGVFIRSHDLLSAAELLMLRATARVHITCDGRSLARMMDDLSVGQELAPDDDIAITKPRTSERSAPTGLAGAAGSREHRLFRTPQMGVSVLAHAADTRPQATASMERPDKNGKPSLLFDNGTGGMTAEGAYQIHVRADALPPAPWANVIANRHGGFVVTERGGGFTWAENSYFFRLTPWYNDPVTDPPGDVLFIRDEETKDLWTATPALAPRTDTFTVRHAPGSSTFEHEHSGIATHLTMGLAEDEAIKVSVLRITNLGAGPRRLTVTAYVEWTLAVLREHAQHQVLTSFDPEEGTIFARNFFDPQFASRVAFCAASAPVSSHTGDRRAFIGRNGTLASPAGLRRAKLDGATGAAADPCAGLQIPFDLGPGETREISILLGAAPDEESARRALATYRAVDAAKAAVARTVASWSDRLSVIKVSTPDPAFDAMLNQWALYQALSCRVWARSALYQSSGAFGFRDQLQDVLALVYAEPALARAHILVATGRQFVEGDVQHWWHPQSGRGVRTRFSDDLAWLPFVVDQYIRVTGDASVLDEEVPFLSMRALGPDEHEIYDLPLVAEEKASVYEHCLRALRRATTAGAHGLPLIGSGDWNDGMSRVGALGRGESVWLAWFLTKTMRDFALRAEARGEDAAAGELRSSSEKYVAAVEAHGWDGAWYRRAYFDDGAPLGSATSEECRIDAIAQSWSVISGAGAPARQQQAMKSLEENLINEDARLLMLLTPPFDKTTHDPGYIKGYLPGVRENGAQYTHAALWTVMATAMQGHGDRAFELFQMINPLTHALTPADIQTYKVEPYVVAADVYTARGQLGRGGWTWYTGSASWLYRVGLESILGFTRKDKTLSVTPCVPKSWPGFTIEYRFGKSQYVITVDTRAGGAREVIVDGRAAQGGQIALVDDGGRHEILVRAGGDEAA